MKKLVLVLSVVILIFSTGCGSDDSQPQRTFEEQLAIDIELIDDYLLQNNIVAQEHESGIRYVINDPGSGTAPQEGNVIAVKFSSYFLDETLLGEDTIGTVLTLQEPIVNAWTLMLPEIEENGKITIYSPSGYLFGTNENVANIPPNSIIVYEIELLRVIDDTAELLDVEIGIIDEYLQENEIEHQVHTSGIRYVVLEEGTGASPSNTDNVAVIYEGSFLSGVVFDSSNSSEVLLDLSNLIESWQIMVPTMQEGGSIRFYSPSRFCYGTNGNQVIPPNTPLVFEIELTQVR